MERAVSDATGAATFQRLIEKPEAPYKLRVEHPAYAVWSGVIAESGETVVALEPGGMLLAHVRSNGTAPPRPLMLTVDLNGGGAAEAHVEMDAGVPCAGKIEAPGFVPSEWGCDLRVSQEDGWRRQTVNLNMQDGKADFTAVGLVPGTYSASLRTINQAQSRDATFSLGPDGDAKLTLDFAADETGN